MSAFYFCKGSKLYLLFICCEAQCFLGKIIRNNLSYQKNTLSLQYNLSCLAAFLSMPYTSCEFFFICLRPNK